MNLEHLFMLLFGPKQRGIYDEQVPTQRSYHKDIDPAISLPLYTESYSGQPSYTPNYEKLLRQIEMEKMVRTRPRAGVMPRLTGYGIGLGYDKDFWDIDVKNGTKF